MNPDLKRKVDAYWNANFGDFEARATAGGMNRGDVTRLAFRLALDFWSDEARAEARLRKTMRQMLGRFIAIRGWSATADQQALIASQEEIEVIQRWCERTITCTTLEEVLEG